MSHPPTGAAAPSRFLDQPTAVWATAFACVVGFMSIGLVDPILTSIAAGLNAGPAQVSLLFTSYFLVTSVMMLVTGFVSSRIGARATLILGAGLIVIFAALAGTSGSVRELVAFRAGWGLGNAFFVVTALSVLVAALAALLAPATLWLRRGSIAHHKAVPATAPAPGLVVAAVDGSDADARVTDRAVALAKATGGRAVLALHVRVSEVLDGAEAETEPRPQAEAIVARARARIAAAGIPAQGEVLHATPGQAVRAALARAEAGGATHVVIGAPHEGALDDLLHGSFARAAEAAGRQAAITVETVD